MDIKLHSSINIDDIDRLLENIKEICIKRLDINDFSNIKDIEIYIQNDIKSYINNRSLSELLNLKSNLSNQEEWKAKVSNVILDIDSNLQPPSNPLRYYNFISTLITNLENLQGRPLPFLKMIRCTTYLLPGDLKEEVFADIYSLMIRVCSIKCVNGIFA